MTRPGRRAESVLVVVYTRTGLALVLERVKPAGFWQSVTGTLHSEELPSAAARRELLEETGIDARPTAAGVMRTFEILPELRDRYPPSVSTNLEHEFRVELADRCPVKLSEREHTRLEWLPLGEAAERVFSWTNRAALRDILHA
ncbi:MAG: dihydroneopterin triphosphate diphosphatase [Xanthomonadales bacterium]|nr:dihydroneopterin triphosphate diphosphatase [Xanthomonadales bacterium]